MADAPHVRGKVTPWVRPFDDTQSMALGVCGSGPTVGGFDDYNHVHIFNSQNSSAVLLSVTAFYNWDELNCSIDFCGSPTL